MNRQSRREAQALSRNKGRRCFLVFLLFFTLAMPWLVYLVSLGHIEDCAYFADYAMLVFTGTQLTVSVAWMIMMYFNETGVAGYTKRYLIDLLKRQVWASVAGNCINIPYLIVTQRRCIEDILTITAIFYWICTATALIISIIFISKSLSAIYTSMKATRSNRNQYFASSTAIVSSAFGIDSVEHAYISTLAGHSRSHLDTLVYTAILHSLVCRSTALRCEACHTAIDGSLAVVMACQCRSAMHVACARCLLSSSRHCSRCLMAYADAVGRVIVDKCDAVASAK